MLQQTVASHSGLWHFGTVAAAYWLSSANSHPPHIGIPVLYAWPKKKAHQKLIPQFFWWVCFSKYIVNLPSPVHKSLIVLISSSVKNLVAEMNLSSSE